MSILDDLVATRAARARMGTNADWIADQSPSTPCGLTPSSGCLPGFKMTRNRREPKPEFRDAMRRVDPRREIFDEQQRNLKLLLRAVGHETRTIAPDPTVRVVRPWTQEFKHNSELSLDATAQERARFADKIKNWEISQKAENDALRAKHFERQANALAEAMAKALGEG